MTSREHREGEAARLGPARYLLPPHVPPPYGKGHRDSTARPFSPAQSGGRGLDSSDPDRPALRPRLRPAGFASLRRAARKAGHRADASAGPATARLRAHMNNLKAAAEGAEGGPAGTPAPAPVDLRLAFPAGMFSAVRPRRPAAAAQGCPVPGLPVSWRPRYRLPVAGRAGTVALLPGLKRLGRQPRPPDTRIAWHHHWRLAAILSQGVRETIAGQ